MRVEYENLNQKYLRMALSILDGFKESGLYSDYQEVDNWTDEEYEEMLEMFRELTY